jgi:hypothetical protein
MGTKGVGSVFFIKEGEDIPVNTVVGGNPRINFPTSSFDEVLDLFRHEKPLYISINPSNGIGTISTSTEPIGEEEDD